ncbi:MAG: hypothetical protein SWH68_11695 [Thermodesulfobacteriota bacterium]|nr:hypothetical protein [Thermodesulfobacteriota bacterium]
MKKRVLLSSVYKPFGVDRIDARRESKIELYHNQLTQHQGIYSMRSFMNSFGLHAIANNLDTPATVLDFPTLKRFEKEVAMGYDIIGIGAILPNFQKVKVMVEAARRISPGSTIVLGGFCASVPDIKKIMDVDYVCVGEGIGFMRKLLGQPESFEFRNPDVYHQDREILGVPIRFIRYPHIVVGLGCSYGCDFCSPSHFFGRRHLRFFCTGEALFKEMERVCKWFRTDTVSFIGDDNFLLDMNRAEALRRCVVKSGENYRIFLFGSADKVAAFGAERLAEMGVNIIWIGRESRFSDYKKNEGVDIKALVAQLRFCGIKVILSSILLTDTHTRRNIMTDIDDHLACEPAFSQFAFLSPAPGTPLFENMADAGRVLTAIPFEEWHAFKQPWFVHPEFNLTQAESIQKEAYKRDFRELGPSLMRYIAVEFEGWQNMKDASNPNLARRAEYFAGEMRKYKILLLAMKRLARHKSLQQQTGDLLSEIETAFGPSSAFEKTAAAGIHAFGRFREMRTRLAGDALQPPTRLVHYKGKALRR